MSARTIRMPYDKDAPKLLTTSPDITKEQQQAYRKKEGSTTLRNLEKPIANMVKRYNRKHK